MKAIEAVTERNRVRTGTDWKICKSCKHSYLDAEEGWNCKKYEAVIELSSGKKLYWPGQACDRAYRNDCKGEGFEQSPFATFKTHPILCCIFIIPALSGLLVLAVQP